MKIYHKPQQQSEMKFLELVELYLVMVLKWPFVGDTWGETIQSLLRYLRTEPFKSVVFYLEEDVEMAFQVSLDTVLFELVGFLLGRHPQMVVTLEEETLHGCC